MELHLENSHESPRANIDSKMIQWRDAKHKLDRLQGNVIWDLRY